MSDKSAGIYVVLFQGPAGDGVGAIVLEWGNAYGGAVGGVSFHGTYNAYTSGSSLTLKVTATVPPEIALAQGIPARSQMFEYDVVAQLPDSGRATVQAQTSLGPVSLTFLKVADPLRFDIR
jgi:hypothetical protein